MSALQGTISAIRAETWEAINRALLTSARQEKVEAGKVARLKAVYTIANGKCARSASSPRPSTANATDFSQ